MKEFIKKHTEWFWKSDMLRLKLQLLMVRKRFPNQWCTEIISCDIRGWSANIHFGFLDECDMNIQLMRLLAQLIGL